MAAFAGGKPDQAAQAMLLSNAEQQEKMMAGVNNEKKVDKRERAAFSDDINMMK